MEDLEALLRDLESSGTPQKCPQNPPGTPPRARGQLGAEAPPPPGPGELERSGGGGENIGISAEPARNSPSAAARELQRLLEALAEFRPRPQPPQDSGAPPGQELEALLQRLQEELRMRGIPTAESEPGKRKGPPLCERCRQPVLGVVVTALGRTWHPEHFCCCHCGAVLGEQGFQERGGRPFCPRDFGALFGPRCRGCGDPVLGEFIAAMGGTWHPPCFVCQDCRAPFPGGSFFQLGGVPLCQRHFRERGEGQGWGRG